VNTLLSDGLSDIHYYDFHKLIKDPKVREEVCFVLHDRYHKTFKPKEVLKMNQLMDVVNEADKDLFIKFRDGHITFDQLRIRIAERKFQMEFKCLDDLKPIIEPKYYENVDQFLPFFEMIYG
jgi:hypothetical protein